MLLALERPRTEAAALVWSWLFRHDQGMTKTLFALVLLYGCAQVSPHARNDTQDLVSVNAALDQARSSYLLGCVEANKSLNIEGSYPACLERAKAHQKDLVHIMDQGN